jgi:hypothetical protein
MTKKNKLDNKQPKNTKGKHSMNTRKLFTICGIAVALAAGAVGVSAQTNVANGLTGVVGSGGQADPAQQRFMQRVHDGLGFTNDADWSAIQPLVQNVFEAQRDLAPGGGVSRVPAVSRGASGTNGVSGARILRRAYFGPTSPEAQALQKTLDENASADDVKTALTAYQAAQKVKRANLAQAQENLRKALTIQQEARATLLKVLD